MGVITDTSEIRLTFFHLKADMVIKNFLYRYEFAYTLYANF